MSTTLVSYKNRSSTCWANFSLTLPQIWTTYYTEVFAGPVWLSREAANPVNTKIILPCHTEGGEGKQSIRGSKPDSVQQCASGWWLGSRLLGPSPPHESIRLKIFLCNWKCTLLEANDIILKPYSLCSHLCISHLCILFTKDWPKQKIKIYFFLNRHKSFL